MDNSKIERALDKVKQLGERAFEAKVAYEKVKAVGQTGENFRPFIEARDAYEKVIDVYEEAWAEYRMAFEEAMMKDIPAVD